MGKYVVSIMLSWGRTGALPELHLINFKEKIKSDIIEENRGAGPLLFVLNRVLDTDMLDLTGERFHPVARGFLLRICPHS
jgi:hypothetical protein